MLPFSIGITVFSVLVIAAGDTPRSHADSIREWQKQREVGLRSETGWLSLVGLFWLKEGDNQIGSGASNDFVLPEKSAPAAAGKFHLQGGKVTFTGANGISTVLPGDEKAPAAAKIGTVALFLIKRGDRYAIRAKDSASPVLVNFKGMKYFPVNEALNFDAKFISEGKKIPIVNILGQTDQEESPGLVEFTFKGKAYRRARSTKTRPAAKPCIFSSKTPPIGPKPTRAAAC